MDIATKIICTIGPSVSNSKKITSLIDSGMNVARINFSHGDRKQHKQIIENLKKARSKGDKPLAIMLDTKGPEIRIEKVFDDEIEVEKGQILKIQAIAPQKENEITIKPFKPVYDIVKASGNMKILFNDGYVATKIISKKNQIITLEVLNSGKLKTNNGVNIPDTILDLPAMTDQDIEDIKFGLKNGIDILAASFIRSAEHVLEIKKLLYQLGHLDVLVIAKIENKQGLDNYNEILEVADGIMVARGDLGVEISFSKVPKMQKMMIRKAYQHFKPVVTATQMLESMINNPRPTRAEASDVANAIYDSTSAVMLSAETAIGSYPIQTVKQMRNIIKVAEGDFDYETFFENQKNDYQNSISSSVAIAAVKTAYSSKAKAFFVYSSSGFTARLISRWRPNIPIIALTTNKKTYHQLSLYWGVIPLYANKCKNEEDAFNIMSKFALENDIALFGDLVVVTAGVPFGRQGSTNLMKLDSIGHVIVRGSSSIGKKIVGRIKIIRSVNAKDAKKYMNKILVIPRCDESYQILFEKAKGVILQNTFIDTSSERIAKAFAKKYKKSLLVQAENAMTLLKDDEKVVLDGEKSLVYFPMCIA